MLRTAVGRVTTLDPMRAGDPSSLLVIRQLYEGLTRWDAATERVVPAAAADWDVRQDGRRFVFTLRPGMTFHDGSPVTADDFRFAFDRVARKRSGSDLAYTLERVRGFEGVNRSGDAVHLSGIKAPDDDTLIIELSEPYQDLPAVLSHPGLVPLPAGRVEEPGFFSEPVGNGPFAMAQAWDQSGDVVLEAFDNFFLPVAVDALRFVPYRSTGGSLLGLIDDEVDVAEVPASEAESVAQLFGDRGYRPLLAGYYYGINLTARGMDRKRLREALARGVDRSGIIADIYEDAMSVPRGIVPTGMPGFTEDACKKLCRYAPKVAERLVDGLSNRKRRVTIEFTRGSPHRLVAERVAANLEDVGLEVTLRSYGFKRYLERLGTRRPEMFRFGWIAEYPVADVFLSPLYLSGSTDNHSGLSSKRVDRLLRQAHRTASPGVRTQLYRRVEELILKRVPVVPIGNFVMHWAARPRVRNIEFDVLGGFDAITVDLAEN